MNKFKKFLVMMLVLITVATLFTVIAFASDAEEPQKEKKHEILYYKDLSIMDNEYEYDGYGQKNETQVGASTGANLKGSNAFVYAAADNGDKYLVHTVDMTNNSLYKGYHYRGNKQYSAADYPYTAVDFDIALLGNDYSTMAFSFMSYAYGDVYDDYGNVASTLPGPVQATNCGFDISYIKAQLPKERLVWSHVTVIYAYNVIDGLEYFSCYAYLNGKKVYENLESTLQNTDYLIENHYFGEIRIRNGIAPKVNTANSSGYDNFQVNFFNDAYTLDEIAAFMYNDDYELPYGKTVARIGNKSYDDFAKAMLAAKNGDVIKLCGDVEGIVNVDKTVIIDTNKYDENENPTGEHYNISTTSSTLVSGTADGMIYFKQIQNASVEIFWDDCPGVAGGGECTCSSEYLNERGEHRMSGYAQSVMLNSTPVYAGEVPVFYTSDGTLMTFAGWSYTKGGDAEDIMPVTAEDIERGYVCFYPVYKQIAFEIVDINEDTRYFSEEEYSAAMDAVSGGGTIKLHKDVTVASGYAFTTAGAKITIDLNGHDFKRFSVRNRHYNAEWDSENSVWKKGKAQTVIGSDGKTTDVYSGGYSSAFSFGKNNIQITLKTSVPGANIYTLTICRDAWYNGEELVGADNYRLSTNWSEGYTGSVLFGFVGVSNTVVNIQGEGLSYYGGTLFHAEWVQTANSLKYYIDGGNYYAVTPSNYAMMSPLGGGVLDVKNATFVTNGATLIKVSNKVGNGTEPNVFTVDFNLTNCVIIGGKTENANALGNSGIKVKDCYYYVSDPNAQQMLTFGSGNYLADITYTNADPLKTVNYSAPLNEKEIEMSFWVVEETRFQFDENNNITFVFTPVKKTYKFTHNTLIPETDYTTVTFKNATGTVISAVKVLKNSTVVPPYIPAGDGFRAVTNSIWKDQYGNPANFNLGDDDSYEFIAHFPEETERKYVADLSVAKLGMSLYTSFKYNLYVPKVDGVDVTSIGGIAPEGMVIIDETEYYVYSVYADFSNAFDEILVDVEYTKAGEDYTATFAISAYVYAMECLDEDSTANELDKDAVASLVRYIEESQAFLAENNILSIPTLKKFDALYVKRTPADYVTQYPTEELCELNIGAVSGLIKSMCFSLVNGSKVGLVVELTDEAIEKGYRVNIVSSINSDVYTDLVSAIYDVSVVDSAGNAVRVDYNGDGVLDAYAQTQYSMATYITAMEEAGENVDIVKALYALGKAVSLAKSNMQ